MITTDEAIRNQSFRFLEEELKKLKAADKFPTEADIMWLREFEPRDKKSSFR